MRDQHEKLVGGEGYWDDDSIGVGEQILKFSA